MRREPPPLRLFEKFSYGLGSTSDAIHGIAFDLFCFFYYTQILGVNASLVGLIVTLALVVDAVSDPAMGMLSDRLKHRWGRRHPPMLLAAFPLGFFFVGLFQPPESFASAGLALWLLVFAVGTRLSLTAFSVPHLALGAELAPTRIGRSRIMSWHAIFLWVGGAACHAIGLTVFFPGNTADGEGMLRAEGYATFGLSFGIALIVVTLMSALLTMQRIGFLQQPDKSEILSKKTLTDDFVSVLKNKNYQWIMGGFFLYAASIGTYSVFWTHMATYYWELESYEYRFYGLAALIGFIFGFMTAARLHHNFGKVSVIAFSAVGTSFACFLPVALRVTGVLPSNESPLIFWFVMMSITTYYCCQSLLIISATSVLGDVADEHELASGKRREGVFYASRTLFLKASSGLGHLLGGLILTLIAFPLGADIRPQDVPLQTIANMGIAFGVIAPVPALFSFFAFRKCLMTTRRHDEVLAQLGRRFC